MLLRILFFEGHFNDSNDTIIKRVGQMIADGADIIDIGRQSTKPGSERIELKEEKKASNSCN